VCGCGLDSSDSGYGSMVAVVNTVMKLRVLLKAGKILLHE
jgi:hypothetical protein